MNVEEARQLAKEKIEQLGAELGRGQSETLRAYLAAMSRMPRYSLNNLLLIAAQRPQARQVAGCTTWQRLGRSVKKGEHGIAILAPVVQRRRGGYRGTTERCEPVADDDQRDSERNVVGFRGAYVFDVSPTMGSPLPDFAVVAGNPGPYTDRLAAFATAKGSKLEFSRRIAPALGACIGATIVLVPDLAPAERRSTLTHEVGHQLLHRNAEAEPKSKTVRETEAQAVAFVVCQAGP